MRTLFVVIESIRTSDGDSEGAEGKETNFDKLKYLNLISRNTVVMYNLSWQDLIQKQGERTCLLIKVEDRPFPELKDL